jgi:hypothetical protein
MHSPQSFFGMKFCTNVKNRNKKNIILHFSHILGKNHQNFKNQVSFSKKSPHFYLGSEGGSFFITFFQLFGQVVETYPCLMLNSSRDACIQHMKKLEKTITSSPCNFLYYSIMFTMQSTPTWPRKRA